MMNITFMAASDNTIFIRKCADSYFHLRRNIRWRTSLSFLSSVMKYLLDAFGMTDNKPCDISGFVLLVPLFCNSEID